MGGKSFCFDRFGLRGVIEAPELTQAPGSPNWLVGAYGHHGRAVATVDIGALFGLTPPTRRPPWLLLVDSAGDLLGSFVASRGKMLTANDRQKAPSRLRCKKGDPFGAS